MAMTFTRVPRTINNRNFKVWTVDCLASDTGPGVQAHNFGIIPTVWLVQNITSAVPPEWGCVADLINITLTKRDTSGGGGGGGPFTTNVDVPPTELGYTLGSNPFGQFEFEIGGAKYLVIGQGGFQITDLAHNGIDGDRLIHVLKSVDNGVTWAETGATIAIPVQAGDGGPFFTAAQDGTKILILHVRQTIGPAVPPWPNFTIDGLAYYVFDTTTDTLSAVTNFDTSVVDLDNCFNHQDVTGVAGPAPLYYLNLVVRGAGDYLLFYSSTQAIDGNFRSGRVSCSVFNGVAFAAPSVLPGQADVTKYWYGISGIYDAANAQTWIFTQSNRAFNFGETVDCYIVPNVGAIVGPNSVTGDAYLDHCPGQFSDPIIQGGNISLAGYINDDAGSTTQSIRIYTAALGVPGVWTNAIINNDMTRLPDQKEGNQNCNRMVALAIQGAAGLVCVWNCESYPPPTFNHWGFFSYSQSVDGGATWSPIATLFPDLTTAIFLTPAWFFGPPIAHEGMPAIQLVGSSDAGGASFVGFYGTFPIGYPQWTKFAYFPNGGAPIPLPGAVTVIAVRPHSIIK